MPAQFKVDDMLKAQQWERTKGELRALVAMQGSYSTGGEDADEYERWKALEERVEAFIREVEEDGLDD